MTSTQLQVQALQEWKRSRDIQGRYHTFEYYWWERYARVYQLASRPAAVAGSAH
ncbi:MAG: hypothetical protein J5I92_02395 [Thiogranum sp.]|nr:hypothetical protein [Thiogranum sp.]